MAPDDGPELPERERKARYRTPDLHDYDTRTLYYLKYERPH